MKKPVKSLGLYIHIPFCKSKCVYCDFYSLPEAAWDAHDGRRPFRKGGPAAAQDRYVRALCRHLSESACNGLMDGYLVDSVYFGGGTPSFLGEKRLEHIMKAVRKSYRLSEGAEVTMEANPDSLGSWRAVRALRKAGFNRISLGVQSADDGELRALGRPHTMQQAAEAVEAVRRAGVDNLSLDLIYGLPGQTMDGWRQTLERAAALEPEHLSCYGLKVEEGTPLWDMRETVELPDDDLQADMYLWTVERLGQLGYAQYEISNFARPGRESRHNLKYWTLAEYAGFGPGAHSDLGGVRYAFVRDLEAYCRGLEEGGEILAEREPVAPWDRDLEYLMLGLRTARGISREEFERRFRLDFGLMEAVLQKCREAGYAALEEDRWRLTPEGFLVSNQIIGQVLDALSEVKRNKIFSGQRYRR